MSEEAAQAAGESVVAPGVASQRSLCSSQAQFTAWRACTVITGQSNFHCSTCNNSSFVGERLCKAASQTSENNCSHCNTGEDFYLVSISERLNYGNKNSNDQRNFL